MSENVFLRKARDWRKARLDRILSPQTLLAGDTFLVEYPKSGITWLTVLIANAFLYDASHNEKVTFVSVRRFIPDLHASRAVAPRLSVGGLGFYKSHAEFNKYYIATLYLVRHPNAVIRSLYKYRCALDPNIVDFDVFLECPVYGLPAWKRHIRSWLFTPRDSAQRFLHLLRYEDIIEDPLTVLTEVNENFGWGLTEEAIINSIELSSREKMRTQEASYRHHNPGHVLDFVGKDVRRNDDDESVKKHIEHMCTEELERLGYNH